MSRSASFLIALAIVGTTQACFAQLEHCNGKLPDTESMSFCDGGVQSTCADISQAVSCTGSRKVRSLVTQNCMDATACDHCKQRVTLCYNEYVCVWDEGSDECENGTLVSSGNISAKVSEACIEPVGGCEAE